MVGSSTDELWMIDRHVPSGELFNIVMQDNIVVVDELLDDGNFPLFFEEMCLGCFEYAFGDTLFVDMFKNDYHLDTMSVAIEKAKPIPGITDDLDLLPRDPVSPDIGCYEFQE